jgi:hypothetical protein
VVSDVTIHSLVDRFQYFSETMVLVHHIAWHHSPQDCNFQYNFGFLSDCFQKSFPSKILNECLFHLSYILHHWPLGCNYPNSIRERVHYIYLAIRQGFTYMLIKK